MKFMCFLYYFLCFVNRHKFVYYPAVVPYLKAVKKCKYCWYTYTITQEEYDKHVPMKISLSTCLFISDEE